MRIANITIQRNYLRNVQTGAYNMYKAQNRVMTERKFDTVGEDPINAVRAFNIRRSLARIDGYVDNVKNMQSKFDQAETVLSQVYDRSIAMYETILTGITDTTNPEDYAVHATALRKLRDEIIDLMNTSYADNYLFGGSNISTAPFAYDEATGVLTYNGMDVRGIVKGDKFTTDTSYIDVGLNMEVDAFGNVTPGTAFENAIRGIDYLGYGEDNLIYRIDAIIDALDNQTFSPGTHGQLLEDFRASAEQVNLGRSAGMGTTQNYLDYTLSRLQTEAYNLKDRLSDVENVDAEEAILDWSMQQYLYNAALQMGQRLLQPSLFDFIK